MASKLRLEKRYIRRILKALYIEFNEEGLPDRTGVVFRLKTGTWRGVIVNAYYTGTILIQGKAVTESLKQF